MFTNYESSTTVVVSALIKAKGDYGSILTSFWILRISFIKENKRIKNMEWSKKKSSSLKSTHVRYPLDTQPVICHSNIIPAAIYIIFTMVFSYNLA